MLLISARLCDRRRLAVPIDPRTLASSAKGNLVEGKSRYTGMIKNPSRHSRPIMDKIIKTFSPLPSSARQSFTFDRGTEFAALPGFGRWHRRAQLVLRSQCTLAKGAVENANKRIRRFMPGDTGLAGIPNLPAT